MTKMENAKHVKHVSRLQPPTTVHLTPTKETNPSVSEIYQTLEIITGSKPVSLTKDHKGDIYATFSSIQAAMKLMEIPRFTLQKVVLRLAYLIPPAQ